MARYSGHGNVNPEINASNVIREFTHVHIKQRCIDGAFFHLKIIETELATPAAKSMNSWQQLLQSIVSDIVPGA